MCLFKIDSVRSFVLSQRIRDIKNNHYWLVLYVTRITGCKLVEDGVRDHWHGPFFPLQ